MNVELAAHILAKGKRLAPDRFPQPGAETAEVWAEALSELDFPAALWSEAVVLWSTKLVGDRMVTPRDLIGAAYTVRDRWEGDPDKAAVLDELRAARANRFYARNGLEPITAADLPRLRASPQRPSQSVLGGSNHNRSASTRPDSSEGASNEQHHEHQGPRRQ